MKSFLKCKCVSPLMKMHYGEFVPLPYNEARSLEASGHVKIVDDSISEKLKEDTKYIYKKHFAGRPVTKVVWIQNVIKTGGAEISNFNCINAGGNFGFDIIAFDPDTSDYGILNRGDVLVVNNLHCGGREKVLKYLHETLKPFVIYSHDAFEGDVEIFKKSKLNVFISPKHRDFYITKCGEEIRDKSIVLPLAFETSRFVPGKAKREPNSVLIVNYDKCRNNAIEFIADHTELNFDSIGTNIPFGKNSKKIENVDYDKMHELYPKYETVYHCPDKFCAGERVVLEAILCGCKIITNENAGHSSWADFDWRNADVLRTVLPEAVSKFWREIDKVISNQFSISFGKKSISIVTRCMGRKSFLEKTLPTWLKYPQIEKIIVVDWGMKEPLDELVTDSRIEIVQVPNKKTFEQGESWNVGIRRVQSDYVFMVDCDVLFNKSFTLDKLLNRIADGAYAENCYFVVAVHPNHLTGTSLFPRAMITAANGFAEGLPTRGFEEIDLRNRCDKAGAVRKYEMWPGMIEHIDHDDAARFENMDKEVNIIEADRLNQSALKEIDVSKQTRLPTECSIRTTAGVSEGVLV